MIIYFLADLVGMLSLFLCFGFVLARDYHPSPTGSCESLQLVVDLVNSNPFGDVSAFDLVCDSGYRHFVAARDFKKGQMLAWVDRSHLFGTNNLPNQMSYDLHNHHLRDQAHILNFLLEKKKGQFSHHSIYLNHLPDVVNTQSHPFFWSQEALHAISGTSAYSDLEESKRNTILAYHDALSHISGAARFEGEFSDEAILEASLLVNSRVFAIGSDIVHNVLVPIFDIFNHADPDSESINVLVHNEMEEPLQRMTCSASRDIKKGEEIRNTYGAHSNFELLQIYGFTLPNNKRDTLRIPFQDASGRSKAFIAKRWMLGNNGNDLNLVAFLREVVTPDMMDQPEVVQQTCRAVGQSAKTNRASITEKFNNNFSSLEQFSPPVVGIIESEVTLLDTVADLVLDCISTEVALLKQQVKMALQIESALERSKAEL
eukprot:CAMPEP_0175139228 /NCGR_PEP_ID=MMETSP0087-20121206/10783_1 /TAXON_ID=136419 /ORGANISM="Unknown Unknown, Strain D1" /LENGTH=429 /DNA_ID=CAMNT_0016422209 /DNA_START=22 /DNA_END=1311 /DNA_ORIENTATION=-